MFLLNSAFIIIWIRCVLLRRCLSVNHFIPSNETGQCLCKWFSFDFISDFPLFILLPFFSRVLTRCDVHICGIGLSTRMREAELFNRRVKHQKQEKPKTLSKCFYNKSISIWIQSQNTSWNIEAEKLIGPHKHSTLHHSLWFSAFTYASCCLHPEIPSDLLFLSETWSWSVIDFTNDVR